MVRLVFAGVACCAFFVGTQDRPIFRLAARTVYIYATVQGHDGRLVTDLTRDDFEVFDNNRPQAITVFDNTPQKITVAVMFDMSRSMAGQYLRIRDAAVALVHALWPEDRASIGSFGMEVSISPFLTRAVAGPQHAAVARDDDRASFGGDAATSGCCGNHRPAAQKSAMRRPECPNGFAPK